MESNQSKNQKLLTPLMLATALVTVTAPVMAYDHDKQISATTDGVQNSQGVIQVAASTFTQTVNPKTGAIYSDAD
jgi:hypothetical protein